MRFYGAVFGLLLAACLPQPPTAPAPALPAAVFEIARTDQVEPPALAVSGDTGFAFVIGSDAAGVHHDVAVQSDSGGWGPPVVLPLPPRHPYHQRAYRGLGSTHLLWLDADPAAPEINRVYGAVISDELIVLRGPTAISAPDHQVSEFSALPRADGGLLVIYQGGSGATADLYQVEVSVTGVPRPAQRIAGSSEGVCTAGNADDGWIFWIAAATGQIRRARSGPDGVSASAAIAPMIYLRSGDRLIGMSASDWGDRAGLIINVAHPDGSSTAWLLTGEHEAVFWDAPQPLLTAEGDPMAHAAFLPGTPFFAGTASGSLGVWRLRAGAASPLGSTVPALLVRPPGVTPLNEEAFIIAWSDVTGPAISQRSLRVQLPDATRIR